MCMCVFYVLCACLCALLQMWMCEPVGMCVFVYFVCVGYPQLTRSLPHRISEFRSPTHASGLNRSASLSCTERGASGECSSVTASNTQLTACQYTPDFYVRALTDLQYVKVTLSPLTSNPCQCHGNGKTTMGKGPISTVVLV